MIAISCSCGSTSTTRSNPLRGLTLGERCDRIRGAHSVHGGFLALEVDASWHPSADEPSPSCVVLADLDALDASVGLADDEARVVRNMLEVAHVGGRLLPRPVDAGGAVVTVTPADDFLGTVIYAVQHGPRTLLEVEEPFENGVAQELADLFARHGAAAVVQADGLAGRIGLRAAVAGITRARTASVA
ncbi:hypothetical protein [Cellulomonas sp. HZM]|uniref:hypothetical protein n=1 Tax=Cellulomonas sp. HZM TaxID=1454010 RepID=UPI000493328D|nr:hypothetical protein [Cellulomonas sp. HZM]